MTNLDLDSNLEFENNFETTIHEITHVLGFASYLYPYYINPNTGVAYGDYPVIIK